MLLTSQAETFLITVISGMVLACLFDGYRVLRGVLRPRWLITWIGDLAYWLLATIMVFLGLLAGNWGEVRLYVFIGLLSGVGVYYQFFSRYTIRFYVYLLRLVAAAVRLLKLVLGIILVKPLVLISACLVRPFTYMRAKAANWRKPPPDAGQ